MTSCPSNGGPCKSELTRLIDGERDEHLIQWAIDRIQKLDRRMSQFEDEADRFRAYLLDIKNGHMTIDQVVGLS